jgi:hypothetical protein
VYDCVIFEYLNLFPSESFPIYTPQGWGFRQAWKTPKKPGNRPTEDSFAILRSIWFCNFVTKQSQEWKVNTNRVFCKYRSRAKSLSTPLIIYFKKKSLNWLLSKSLSLWASFRSDK